VARGYLPGVYKKTWTAAKLQVDGFQNAMHKSFKSSSRLLMVEKYVKENREHKYKADDYFTIG
jgi:viroplasmin and RNaseH domain-containing protein